MIATIMGKCAFCEEEMPVVKMYSVTLKHNMEDWTKSLIANGHKGCLSGLQTAYKRFGRIMTMDEVEAESFDPMI